MFQMEQLLKLFMQGDFLILIIRSMFQRIMKIMNLLNVYQELKADNDGGESGMTPLNIEGANQTEG